MIKLTIEGKTCIIRKIRHDDGESFEAEYHGWFISIFPMWGKLLDGRYREDRKTGELGVDVSGPDGGKIVDSVQPTRQKALIEALENILLCRPRYGEI
jgi:hypothetical protein